MNHAWVLFFALVACAQGRYVEPDARRPRGDAGATDQGADQAAATDQGADQAAAADQGADQAAAADRGADLGPTGPCAKGGAVVKTYDAGPSGPTMQICEFTTEATQCEAVKRCAGAGWHLCTSSEFLAGGGRTDAHAERAWIGGCVRTDGDVHAPTNGVCADCVRGDASASASYYWYCEGNTSGGSRFRSVGLVTSDICNQVGVKDPSTAAFWGTAQTWSFYVKQVVCCR